MDKRAIEIGAECFANAMSDDAWKAFGYKGRPKSGTLFQGLRPKWKVILEQRLFRELAIVMYSSYLVSGYMSEATCEASIKYFMAQPNFSSGLGFEADQKGIIEFVVQIDKYASLDTKKWGAEMARRLDYEAVPAKKKRSQIMFGCSQIVSVPRHVAEECVRRGLVMVSNDDNGTDLDAESGSPSVFAMTRLARMSTEAAQKGTDRDEVPGGMGEFGYDLQNPIPVNGIAESKIYLSRLRWNGRPVTWKRIGSFGADNVEMPIDGYSVVAESGTVIATLYVSPYHRKMSGLVPNGFTLSGVS